MNIINDLEKKKSSKKRYSRASKISNNLSTDEMVTEIYGSTHLLNGNHNKSLDAITNTSI